MMKKVSEFVENCALTFKSVVKIVLLSRKVVKPLKCDKKGDSVVVLGNGPSLRKTIDNNVDSLKTMPTVAVNFMANAPDFKIIKPDYYVLADPHFFKGVNNENVASLWFNLASVEWQMTLCVPVNQLSTVKTFIGENQNVRISTFNFVGAEGFACFESLVYSRALAMPRPRNVLIPAIMCAVMAGYKDIFVAGADHSWLETIRVSDENHVVSVQPHFYADSKVELKRSEEEYKGYRLHDILKSFYIAFKSYHKLQRFAKRNAIAVYNATPGSYIDAFERKCF